MPETNRPPSQPPTQGEKEMPGGKGGGTDDKTGPGTDKSGTGQGGDKPSGGDRR
jgi:hypothetical protein